jgi:SAM-dependent methyltransferase
MSDAPHCPLCQSDAAYLEDVIEVAAIRAYWRTFGYGIDTEFPDLPETLRRLRCNECALGWFLPALIGGPSLYAALTAWPPYYDREAWEWPIAIDILSRAGVRSIVEVGAGTGEFLARAAAKFPRVLGLEFSTAAVITAQSKGRPVINRPLSKISERPDAIVAFQMLEHVADPAAFIVNCRDTVCEGGLLAFAVPNDDGAVGVLPGDFLNLPPHHATRWRRATFEAVGRLFSLALVGHLVEPLDRDLHLLYWLRHLKPTDDLRAKFANLVRRNAIKTMAPLAYRRDRARLGGKTQLAIFRKTR